MATRRSKTQKKLDDVSERFGGQGTVHSFGIVEAVAVYHDGPVEPALRQAIERAASPLPVVFHQMSKPQLEKVT